MVKLHVGMARAERRGEARHHRQRGRDRGDAQPAGEAVAQRVDLLPHGAGVADDAARPVEHALALRGEAAEARAAVDQQHADRLLELLDAGRQRRLGHAAGFGGAAEMPLARQRQEKFELVDQCDDPYLVRTARIANSIENFNRSMAIGGLFLIDDFRLSGLQEGFQAHGRAHRPTKLRFGTAQPPRKTPKGRQVDPRALEEVRALLGERERRRDLLIEHLHLIQDHYGHLSAAHLAALAQEMKLALTEVYEVATFYAHFDVVKEGETPPPAVTVRVCDSLSCAMAGAEHLLREPAEQARPRRARRARALHGRLRPRAGLRRRPRRR